MRGWMIVPKGTGDVQARVEALAGGRKAEAVAITVYLVEKQAQAAYDKLDTPKKSRSELLPVEVTLNPSAP